MALIQSARQDDYLQFISEKAQVGGEVFRNKSAIQALLGIDSEADAEPELTEVPGDSTPESENSESNQSDGDSGSDDDDNVEEGDPVTEEVEN